MLPLQLACKISRCLVWKFLTARMWEPKRFWAWKHLSRLLANFIVEHAVGSGQPPDKTNFLYAKGSCLSPKYFEPFWTRLNYKVEHNEQFEACNRSNRFKPITTDHHRSPSITIESPPSRHRLANSPITPDRNIRRSDIQIILVQTVQKAHFVVWWWQNFLDWGFISCRSNFRYLYFCQKLGFSNRSCLGASFHPSIRFNQTFEFGN